LNNVFIKTFNTLSDASIEVLGTINGSSLIKTCCEGKRDSYKNFK
jgi:hypothetical protein